MNMSIHVIEISTEVFQLLRHRAPRFIGWSEEQPGPTQKILLDDDVYTEFIDRAIAHRQTLDQVVRELCTRTADSAYTTAGGRNAKRVKNSN
jgi:hypothetical protein